MPKLMISLAVFVPKSLCVCLGLLFLQSLPIFSGSTISCAAQNSTAYSLYTSSETRADLSAHSTPLLSIEFKDFEVTTAVASLFSETPSHILTWATVNKENNKGFQVERQQATGDSWETLGFIAAKGKSATYTFTDAYRLSSDAYRLSSDAYRLSSDAYRLSSVAYYRLRQIDNDGKEAFSQVLSVSNPQNNKLKIYPNPVSSLLTIENISESSFQILNLLGQQVLTGKTPSGGRGLDVSALPQGSYIFKVGTDVAKFLKQ
jgi:Secretion system C-terminal sorting domain